MKRIPWTCWSTVPAEVGYMPLKNVNANLQVFREQAKVVLDETGADHVLYGIKYYDDEGDLKKVHFYCLPMNDETFYSMSPGVSNAVVYALHARK